MTTPSSTDHDALVSLLWELKALWQEVIGEEVLLTNLLLEPRELDRFLERAAATGNPKIRDIVTRIVTERSSSGGQRAMGDSAPAVQPGPTVASASGPGPRPPAPTPSSGFDKLRGGAALLASLLVSAAAGRYLLAGDAPVPRVAATPAVASVGGPRIATPPAAPIAAADPSPLPGATSTPAASRPTAAPTLEQSDLVLRIHGSNTVGEKLGPALVDAFLRRRGATEVVAEPGATPVERSLLAALPGRERPVAIEIHAHGSSTAFEDLARGTANLGQSSRRIKPEEVGALKAKYGDLSRPGSEHVLALDGLAIIVNPANPVSGLTIDQIAGIFSGRIKDWSEVSASSGPISLYARDDVSGTWDTFKHLVLSPSGVELDASARRFESSSELSDEVATDTGGIGFIGLPYVRRAKLLAVAAEPGSLALLPTPFTVGTEDYPLSRRLYFYAGASTSDEMTREFLDFALSDAGKEVVEEIGFVSQNVALERPPIADQAPAPYRKATADSDRISLNFRFESGGEELDAKAHRDLDRVIDFLNRDRGREVLLFGFTDDRGAAQGNLALAQRRADVVAEALVARGVQPRLVLGLGEVMPIASNSSADGRNRNRRVEIWVR